MIREIPRRILGTLGDALFPVRCIGCNTYDTWLCAACHARLPLINEQRCPLCTTTTGRDGAICLPCAQKPQTAIDGVYVASLYSDPLLKHLIHTYKYRFVRDLATPLALLLAQSLRHSHLPAPDLIIPVPLHARRLRWRGFNHAEMLAHALNLDIPLNSLALRRTRYTTPQAQFHRRAKRITNLNNAFSVVDEYASTIAGTSILLIDDVATTGTTMNACARALKDAGAVRVTGLVLARE